MLDDQMKAVDLFLPIGQYILINLTAYQRVGIRFHLLAVFLEVRFFLALKLFPFLFFLTR